MIQSGSSEPKSPKMASKPPSWFSAVAAAATASDRALKGRDGVGRRRRRATETIFDGMPAKCLRIPAIAWRFFVDGLVILAMRKGRSNADGRSSGRDARFLAMRKAPSNGDGRLSREATVSSR